jgi:chemotaxis protein MotB
MGKKREPKAASSGWLNTYADMITLCMCFFVMLYEPAEVDITQIQAMTAAISNDMTGGGQSLQAGRLSDLGNNINSLPSAEKGKSMAKAAKKAVSLFAPDIKSNRITITSDERGLIVTLASDAFFKSGSADIAIEETRETLLRLGQFLSTEDLSVRRFRIEGHTDSSDSGGTWKSNWELSSARAINVLHALVDFGANERQFSVAGYADTRSVYANDTPEGRAYNRRVDIIILDEGHF